MKTQSGGCTSSSLRFLSAFDPHFFLLASVILTGISLYSATYQPASVEAGSEQPAVRINNLKLTEEEVRQEIGSRGWTHAEPPRDAASEPEWLSEMITRELLVQEAQRLGLDRKPEFMRAIERFWKEGLIKILIDRKAREISSRTHVFEPEIEAYYKKLIAGSGAAPQEPFSVLREEMERKVREEKETQAMEEWLADLRRGAQIEVDHEALAELK